METVPKNFSSPAAPERGDPTADLTAPPQRQAVPALERLPMRISSVSMWRRPHAGLHEACLQEPLFMGRTDAEAEAPILWPPGGESHLIGKGPDAGKD